MKLNINDTRRNAVVGKFGREKLSTEVNFESIEGIKRNA